MRRLLIVTLSILIAVLIGTVLFIPTANEFQTEGKVSVPGLSQKVEVLRDEKGMPYIYANNLMDAIRAQGYVMAQDRLFQMQLTRLFAEGRISELAGEKALELDARNRAFGFSRLARKHVQMLDEENTALLKNFTAGINQYIAESPDIPIAFPLAGIEPEPFDPAACLSILYYLGWDAASNYKTEFLSQILIDKVGYQKFMEIYPQFSNPDYPDTYQARPAFMPDSSTVSGAIAAVDLNSQGILEALAAIQEPSHIGWGSNNWVTAPSKSTSGKPMLANDPHLDPRNLPGTLYSCGIITPELRAVGATVPGLPGLIIGRNQFFTSGLTNGYSDAQDLYIETPNPDNPNEYMEGKKAFPFKIVEEKLAYKDPNSESGFSEKTVKIRFTRRGPIISDLLPNLNSSRLISLRWSAAEVMKPKLGLTHILEAKSIEEAKQILSNVTMAFHNVTMADIEGNIGWQTLGAIPIRKKGEGMLPKKVVDSTNNWIGFIPFEEMPQAYNPEKGWLGNANNNLLSPKYPHYISNHYSPYYRYQRLRELMDSKAQLSAQDHWAFQRDVQNVLARKIAPIFAEHLATDPSTSDLGNYLKDWNYEESLESAAATIYQYLYFEVASRTFADELGEEVGPALLNDQYFWQERFEQMLIKGESSWFDNAGTAGKESLQQLIVEAGKAIKEDLTQQFGEDMEAWQWGNAHKITFTSPLRREGPGQELFGGSTWSMAGSAETLYRAKHEAGNPENIVFVAAMRMVVDLNDDDKVMAVLAGGESERNFTDHQSDQLQAYFDGEVLYWWYSDKEIKNHAVSTLVME